MASCQLHCQISATLSGPSRVQWLFCGVTVHSKCGLEYFDFYSENSSRSLYSFLIQALEDSKEEVNAWRIFALCGLRRILWMFCSTAGNAQAGRHDLLCSCQLSRCLVTDLLLHLQSLHNWHKEITGENREPQSEGFVYDWKTYEK